MRYLMGDAAPREPVARAACRQARRECGAIGQGRSRRASISTARSTGAKLRRPMLYVPPSMPAMNLLHPHAVDAHPHGAGRRRVRRHRRPRHHRGSGRAGRRRDRGRARRGGGRQHRRRSQARPASRRRARRSPSSRQQLGIKLLEAGRGGRHRHARRPGVRDASAACRRAASWCATIPGVEFEVLDADPRRVRKLKIHQPKGSGATQPERGQETPPPLAPAGPAPDGKAAAAGKPRTAAE